MHKPSGNWSLGLVMAALTCLAFGLLPIALKGLLATIDPFTVTWYRFVIAAGILALFIVRPRKITSLSLPGIRLGGQVVIAGALMSTNYLCYGIGLMYVSPSTAQIVIQLAPMFLLIGSLIVYREPFSAGQWIGFAVVVFGQLLFFNEGLDDLFGGLSGETAGVLLIVTAAFSWSIYGLLQKRLLRAYSSAATILMFYIVGAIIYLPLASPLRLFDLNQLELLLLGICGLTSLISYVAFAEALNHWEASRVSASLAIVPILTVASVQATNMLWPEVIPPESLSLLSIGGALLVVAGSMLSALLRK